MDPNRYHYGWQGQILRVDLTRGETSSLPIGAYPQLFVGGRGINTKLLFDRLDPQRSPFDPENALCIGAGPLVGTPAPSSARATLSALSPRGLIDYSSIGGFVGPEMKFAGYDHIVITGRAEKPVYLFVSNDTVQVRSAADLWGRDPFETQERIRKELHDPDIQSLAIGLAGENRVHFACVSTGRLTSVAGRCGIGAVMGSKNLKAVAVRGKQAIRIARPKRFLSACHEFRQNLTSHPIFQSRRSCGSDKSIFQRHLIDGGKFVAGNWESAEWQSAGFYNLLEDPETFWRQKAGHYHKAGPSQPGCFGCPIYHETFFDIPEVGDIGRTKCVEWLCFSGTVWITDRRQVNHAAYVCNKYGLDAVSAANCISFLMELYARGMITEKDTDGIAMRRGDIGAVIAALEKMAHQEGFGCLLRRGVADAARQIGKGAESCAMQIKGLELFPEEVRAYKSLALLVSVGKSEQFLPMDYSWGSAPTDMERLAEETYGDRRVAIPNAYAGKAQLTWDGEQIHGITDLLGICKLLIPWGFSNSLQWPAQLLSLATGIEYDPEQLRQAAQRVLLLERAYNTVRGVRRQDEQPPRRLFAQKVPDGRFKGERLDERQFNAMLDDYYRLRGCDLKGRPLKETFDKLNLKDEWLQCRDEI